LDKKGLVYHLSQKILKQQKEIKKQRRKITLLEAVIKAEESKNDQLNEENEIINNKSLDFYYLVNYKKIRGN
jgi:cell division protein FtsB